MDRSWVSQRLAQHKGPLAHRFGVIRLVLFGSLAREAAHEGSDWDILVSFDGPATSARHFGEPSL